MRTALTLFVLAAPLVAASAAEAVCRVRAGTYEERIGHRGWLIANDDTPLAYTLDDAPPIGVPGLQQTGPDNWKSIPGEIYPQATGGRIEEGIRRSDGYIEYFRFRTDNGKEIVVEAYQVETFYYPECDAATLLHDRSTVSVPLGKVRGLPMVPIEGARPLDFGGDWIPESHLEYIVYLNCNAYRDGVLGSPDLYAECAPVWKAGETIQDLGLAQDLYYRSEDLVQITEVPEASE